MIKEMDTLTNEEVAEEDGDIDYGELIEQYHLVVVKNLDLNRQFIFRYFLSFINLFHTTGLFLYPLKTLESLRFCDVFSGGIERVQ